MRTLTTNEIQQIKSLYAEATTRKVWIAALATCFCLAAIYMLLASMDEFGPLFVFIGAGTCVITYGIVMALNLINDTYYDIVDTIYLQQSDGIGENDHERSN